MRRHSNDDPPADAALDPDADAPGAAPGSVDVTLAPAAPRGVVCIVELRGEHDVSDASRLRTAVRWIPRDGALLVDLTACTFLDSAIILELLRLSRRQPTMAVALPPDETSIVCRAIQTLALADVLRCHAGRDAALAALDATADVPQAELAVG